VCKLDFVLSEELSGDASSDGGLVVEAVHGPQTQRPDEAL